MPECQKEYQKRVVVVPGAFIIIIECGKIYYRAHDYMTTKCAREKMRHYNQGSPITMYNMANAMFFEICHVFCHVSALITINKAYILAEYKKCSFLTNVKARDLNGKNSHIRKLQEDNEVTLVTAFYRTKKEPEILAQFYLVFFLQILQDCMLVGIGINSTYRITFVSPCRAFPCVGGTRTLNSKFWY